MKFQTIEILHYFFDIVVLVICIMGLTLPFYNTFRELHCSSVLCVQCFWPRGFGFDHLLAHVGTQSGMVALSHVLKRR